MLKKIGIGLLVVIGILAVVIAMQPADFHVSRSALMNAPAAAPFAQVNDLHQWGAWDPWAKIDPNSKVAFEGPAAGTGAKMSWAGNKDVGEGTMTITESQPNSLIRMDLEFRKPMAGRDTVEFTFTPEGKQTRVTWTMNGKKNFVAKAIGLVMDCEKMTGDMFDKGLASIKTIVETTPNKK